jgi:hypothetical protein
VTNSAPAPDRARPPQGGALARCLVTLASTPDDDPDIDLQLVAIARLTADAVSAVSYASTTALREGAYTTVAATSELALAVDEAQYADGDGPCLAALREGTPTAVPDIGTTMRWPGFQQAAFGLGLRSSLSIPLFAGSGEPVAAMNLYSHDSPAMTTLTARIRAVYGVDQMPGHGLADPDAAADANDDLSSGLEQAFAIRNVIQSAIGVLMQREHCSASDAYLSLRLSAADAGDPLPDFAARTVRRTP